MSILDAKDLLVHSPRVISNIIKRMFDIKLLRCGLYTVDYTLWAIDRSCRSRASHEHSGRSDA